MAIDSSWQEFKRLVKFHLENKKEARVVVESIIDNFISDFRLPYTLDEIRYEYENIRRKMIQRLPDRLPLYHRMDIMPSVMKFFISQLDKGRTITGATSFAWAKLHELIGEFGLKLKPKVLSEKALYCRKINLLKRARERRE